MAIGFLAESHEKIDTTLINLVIQSPQQKGIDQHLLFYNKVFLLCPPSCLNFLKVIYSVNTHCK